MNSLQARRSVQWRYDYDGWRKWRSAAVLRAQVCVIAARSYPVALLTPFFSRSYLATTWLFVTWNMICVIFALQNALATGNTYGVRTLVATALALRRYRVSGGDVGAIEQVVQDAGLQGSSAASASIPAGSVPALVRAFFAPTRVDLNEASCDDIAAACDDDDMSGLNRPPAPPFSCCRCCCTGRIARALLSVSSARAWYFASICVLAAYIGVNIGLSSSEPNSGRYLCLITSATVLLIDATVAAMWGGALLRSTGSVSIASAAARIALISFGTNYWLLGQCMVYVVLGIYLAHTFVAHRFASGTKVTTLRSLFDPSVVLSGSALPPAPPAAAAAGASGAAAPAVPAAQVPSPPNPSTCWRLRSWAVGLHHVFFHPAGLLLAVTVVFTVFIAGLAVAMNRNPSTIPGATVPTIQGNVEQYDFGVGAICVVVIWLCGETGLRLWWQGHRSFDRSGWTFQAIFWIVCGVCGGVLAALTKSYIILVCGVVLPPLSTALLFGYGRWVLDDYVCILPAGFEITKITSGAISLDARRNWAMAFSVAAVLACLCSFGAAVGATVRRIISRLLCDASHRRICVFAGVPRLGRMGRCGLIRDDYLHGTSAPPILWNARADFVYAPQSGRCYCVLRRCARESHEGILVSGKARLQNFLAFAVYFRDTSFTPSSPRSTNS